LKENFFVILDQETRRNVSIRKRYAAQVFCGQYTLKELAEFVRTFNKVEKKDSPECVRIIHHFMHATHVHEIRIPGVLHGRFESFWQAERNGPMLPGPRSYLIELDWNNRFLVIKKRAYMQAARCRNEWFVEQVIPLNRIRKIKIVRVPVGLRHLEIQLHTPCSD